MRTGSKISHGKGEKSGIDGVYGIPNTVGEEGVKKEKLQMGELGGTRQGKTGLGKRR